MSGRVQPKVTDVLLIATEQEAFARAFDLVGPDGWFEVHAATCALDVGIGCTCTPQRITRGALA